MAKDSFFHLVRGLTFGAMASLMLASCGGDTGSDGGEQCPLTSCTVGETSCAGATARVSCVDDMAGCGHLSVSACAEGEVCEAGQCVAFACPEDSCVPGDGVCLDGQTIALCVAEGQGCGLMTQVACGAGTRCEGGECIGDCVDLDADGYGVGCAAGPDCDDGDPDSNPASEEICDGKDNDCDDEVDEGFVGLGDACAAGLGICETPGSLVCNGEGSGVMCDALAGVPAEGELCNGLDDDCDGESDEDFDAAGEVCTVGQGVCERAGLLQCNAAGTGLECSASPGDGSLEICNGLDDNCDGQIDEGETCGVACELDALEPNDTAEEAAIFGDRQVHEGTLCYYDKDFFSIGTLEANMPVTINVLFSHAASDINIEVYKDGDIVHVGDSTTDNEQLSFVTQGSGLYTFALFQPNRDAAQTYRLSLTLGGDCADDIYEVNDNAATAVDLAPGVDLSGIACGTSVGGDWYDLGLLEESTLIDAQLLFSHASGNIDLFLLREGSAQPVAQSTSTEDNEAIEYFIEQPGRYFLQVKLLNQTPSNTYTLSYTRIDDHCLDDAFDQGGMGDSAANPISLPLSKTYPDDGTTVSDLKLCPMDDDFFSLGTFEAAQRGQVNVIYDDAQGTLGVEILGPDSSLVEVDMGNTDHLTVPFSAPVGGTYYARVIALGGQPHYRISNPTVHSGTCPPDVYEADNLLEQAFTIAPDRLYTARACQTSTGTGYGFADFDTFGLGMLEAGQTVTALATFRQSDGDLDLVIWDSTGNTQVVEDSSTDDELLIWEVPASGRYYLGALLYTDFSQSDGLTYRIYHQVE